MFNEEIEKILKLTDEDLFHEKDYAKASLIETVPDIKYLKNILTGISSLNNIKNMVYNQHIVDKTYSLFTEIKRIFETMKAYNGTNKSNIRSQINNLVAATQNNYIDVLALISYERTNLIFDEIKKIGLNDLGQISSKIKEIEDLRKQILKYEKEAKKSLESIQSNANKVGVSKYSSIFKEQAEAHKRNSWFWFLGIIGILLVIIGFAVCLLEDCFKFPNDASWGIIVQFTTAKLIIFSILCVALSWTIKSYKANKHNEVLNKHRQNALDIFETFVNGTSDEQTKNAVLLQAVQSIFAQQNTGYNDNETETGNAQTKILEFVSSSIKNDTK